MNAEIEILLIEDNPFEAGLAIKALKKQNLVNNLLHIDDGSEALDFMFSKGKYSANTGVQRPKLIFLDLHLPKMDGIEILRRLKTNEKTKSIPVVILTSSKEEKDIAETYRLGANSYITKPLDFESFSKAVVEAGLYWIVLNESPPYIIE